MTSPMPPRSSEQRPGRLSRAFSRLFMTRARIVGAERIGERFRLLTLESPGFRSARWMPGQKLQVAMGSAFVARTFTPIEWDAKAGRTRFLGYVHGSGPGSAWLDAARAGGECDVFGPRASLDLRQVAAPCVVFGDETSIGLVYALDRNAAAGSCASLLEVGDVADARDVVSTLGLRTSELFQRTAEGEHLDDVERRLPALAAAGATFVLTGRASSIQRLRRVLKVLDIPSARLAVKPYWAPGKVGLD